jgi:membrane-bound lytic murein transglycosylase B
VPALRAYATAQLRLAAEQPECHVGWTTLAGIGWVESQHGGYGGRTLGVDGRPSSPILGPTLDGSDDVAAIPDEEGGWAQAAGPMQFIPSTWARWGADGDEDGVVDVEDLDDAAYAAARYLCASGSLASGAGWARAVFSYNHSQAYVDQVYAAAQAYAGRTGS